MKLLTSRPFVSPSAGLSGWIPAITLALCVWALPAAADPAPDPDAALDQAVSEKIDGYVSCINFHGNWTLQSRDRYFSWLKSPEKGPTGREDNVLGLYALRDPADCRKEILAAAALPPDDPELESAADAYIKALDAARPVVDEANQYYELGEWQDDGMRRGKDLHPRLVAVFEAFAQADHALRGRVTVLQDAAGERLLARLAAKPELRSVYLVEHLLMSAKKLLDSSEGIGGKAFQREPFTEALSRFETAWKDYDSFRKSHPDHTDSVIKDSMVAHSSFELLKSAKSMARHELKGFRFDEGERMLIEANAPQMVEGHPAQLVDRYNQFITFMNSARR